MQIRDYDSKDFSYNIQPWSQILEMPGFACKLRFQHHPLLFFFFFSATILWLIVMHLITGRKRLSSSHLDGWTYVGMDTQVKHRKWPYWHKNGRNEKCRWRNEARNASSKRKLRPPKQGKQTRKCSCLYVCHCDIFCCMYLVPEEWSRQSIRVDVIYWSWCFQTQNTLYYDLSMALFLENIMYSLVGVWLLEFNCEVSFVCYTENSAT